MNNVIVKLLFSLVLFLSFSLVQAEQKPDGVQGFVSEEACLAAVRSGKAEGYVPVVQDRPPGPSYKKMSMSDTTYKNGACVTGLTKYTSSTWVYLPPNFQVGQLKSNTETLVMWVCGNAIAKISAIPMDQLITRPAATTTFDISPGICTASQERCEMISWCDQNKGWETKEVDGKIVQFCSVASTPRLVQRRTDTEVQDFHVVTPTQVVVVNTVKPAAPAEVAFPNVQINARGGGVDVSGNTCRFDCKVKVIVTDVPGYTDIPSPNGQCEIRWKATFNSEQGRILLDNYGGKIRLAKIVPGKNVPEIVAVTNWTHSRDCDQDQDLIKRNWLEVVRGLRLPTCEPVNQSVAQNQKPLVQTQKR